MLHFVLHLVLLMGAGPEAGPVTFADAIALARRHPRVVAAGEVVAQRTDLDGRISSLSANPTLTISPGWREGRDDSGFEGVVSVAQPFSLSGAGTSVRVASQARTRAAHAYVGLVDFETRLDVAAAWLDLDARQREYAMLVEEERVAADLLAIVQRAVDAGRLLAVDLADAEIYQHETTLERIDAEGRVVDGAHRLAAELAVAASSHIVAAGPAPDLNLPENLESAPWLKAAARLPEAAWQALAHEARAVETTATDRQASTTMGAGVSLQREATGDIVGLLNVSITPSLFAQNRAGIADAKQAEIESASTAELAALSSQRALVMALHEVEHTRETALQVGKKLLPAAERYAALVDKQLTAGLADAFAALRARRRVMIERRRFVAAELERRRAEVRASFLLGALGFEGELVNP